MSSTHAGALSMPVLRACAGLLISVLLPMATTNCGGGAMPSGSSSTIPATPAPLSPPNSTVTTTSPGGPTITLPKGMGLISPLIISGDATQLPNVDHVRLLMDGPTSVLDQAAATFANKVIFLPVGQHQITLAAYDVHSQQIGATTTVPVNVISQTSPAILSSLQTVSGWLWCTASLGGRPCASGLGNATSTQVQNQATPSLSGSSTEFTIAGPTGYSNALWWISLGGGTLLSQFTYEMDFYIDNAALSEALEFDLNQSFGNVRYTYGTECSFLNTKKWDVWNPKKEIWVTTSAPCPQVTSNEWHHLKWQFERVNNQVHYISVTVDSNTYPLNLYFDPQPGWSSTDLNIAFQLDGNYKQAPYNAWLDNVTLTASY